MQAVDGADGACGSGAAAGRSTISKRGKEGRPRDKYDISRAASYPIQATAVVDALANI